MPKIWERRGRADFFNNTNILVVEMDSILIFLLLQLKQIFLNFLEAINILKKR